VQKLRTYLSVLRIGGFSAYWLSQACFTLGYTCLTLVLPLQIYEISQTGAAIGGLMFFRTMPLVVLGAFAGVLLDRWNRKRTMVICSIAFAVIATAYYWATTPWQFYALTFLWALVMTAYKPARFVVVPNLVPGSQLLQANSLILGTDQFISMAGTAALGYILDRGGASITFVLSSTLLLASGLLIAALVPIPQKVEENKITRKSGFVDDFIQGWRYLYRHPILWPLTIVITLMWLGLSAQTSILVILAKKDLGLSDMQYAFLSSASSVGGVVGTLLAPMIVWCTGGKRFTALAWGLAGAGVAALLLSLVSGFASALVLVTVLWTSAYVAASVEEALEQEFSPNEIRGRVLSTISAIGMAGYMIGISGAPFLSDLISVRAVIAVSGVVVLLVAALVVALIRLRGETAVQSLEVRE